jgi:hypothetical protein
MPYVSEYEASPKTNTLGVKIRHFLFGGDATFVNKLRQFRSKPQRRENQRIFLEFADRHIPRYQSEYIGYRDLERIARQPEFEGFVCGSDQVWNAWIHSGVNDPGYFLHFVSEGVKRIAYAPCFGVASLPRNAVETLGESLKGFDALSVRERTGAGLIRKVAGLEVPVVLDPTMLLTKDQWSGFESDHYGLPEKYIFCYKFTPKAEVREMIRQIGRKTGLPIVEPACSAESYGDRFDLRFDIGPAEFLRCIHRAELVLTDSFHASVFSILYHKPFLTFMRDRDDSPRNMNSRMVDLLTSTRLTQCMVLNGEDALLSRMENIDFGWTDAFLGQERAKSLEYLGKALEWVRL